MAAGLGLLGHTPAAFWAMTPRELDAALRGKIGVSQPAGPPALGELAALMARYPDARTHSTRI